MLNSISRTELEVLLREADRAARRLVRRFGLPIHECEDLCQDLVADALPRLKAFDPARGSFGAFAGIIIAHRATRLANRIQRQRANFPLVSLSEPLPDADGQTLGDTIAGEDGGGASYATDQFAAIERYLDLERGLSALETGHLRLCAGLLNAAPTELSKSAQRSRASIYRDLKEVRLRLLLVGLAAA